MTIDRLATTATPDRQAIVVPGGAAVTYGELDHRISAFAGTLHRRGAIAGDRLALANANTVEFFVALLGAARAGLTAVPIDAKLAAGELANLISHARPHAVVIDETSAQTFASLGVPTLAVEADGAPFAAPAPEQPALVLYTSGTTGSPRGALHSHAGVLAKTRAIASWFGLGAGDATLCMLPTHFGHGLVCSCLTTLAHGGTLVLCRPFDLELIRRVFALADEHGVTTFSTVPTIVRLLLRDPSIARPTSGGPRSTAEGGAESIARPRSARLRYVTCASAPLHAEEVEAFEARFGVPLLNCYGMTEAGTWSALSPIDASRDRRSIGMAVGCELRVVDPAGAALPPGEIGELQIAGPSVMLGYDRDDDATAHVLRGGWLSTGDLGSVDATGCAFLAGRSKDLIIRAGANIYPADVERALLRHHAVAEAHVVGVPHPLLGEQVVACVVSRAGERVTERDLIALCRESLATYKCPERIVFVDAVPRTSRGKVSRHVLATLVTERTR